VSLISFSTGNSTITENFTYTVNDDNETVLVCETASDCVTFTVNGDKLIEKFSGNGCNITIMYEMP